MKNKGIQNKERYIEITINEREAKRLLIDLEFIKQIKEPMPETKCFIKMLEKFNENGN
jgi:hypothetical protein